MNWKTLIVAGIIILLSGTVHSMPLDGLDFDGGTPGDNFGRAVSLSADGLRLAVGVPSSDSNGVNDDSGQVRVFAWSGGYWKQLGADLNGKVAGDYFGYAVSLSADGHRLVVGVPYSDVRTGQVRVFEWSGDDWKQLGADLNGEAAGDNLGRAVSLSADGLRLAVGSPYWAEDNDSLPGQVRVFDWSGDDWMQLGANLSGEAADDNFGYAVSLSPDGSRLAVGAPGVNLACGFVDLFKLSEDSWEHIWKLSHGIDSHECGSFGHAVSLLDRPGALNASILAVGVPDSSINGAQSGHVSVFWVDWDFGPSQILESRCHGCNGEDPHDRFGYAVSLSPDGSRLAVGAPWHNDNVTEWGQVRILDQLGDGMHTVLEYTELGPANFPPYRLYGEATGDPVELGDAFGLTVSLSAGGLRLAAGAPHSNVNGAGSGQVRLFDFPIYIDGEHIGTTTGSGLGWAVSLSEDGDRLAMGDPYWEEHDYSRPGRVRVVELSGDAWTQLGSTLQGSSTESRFGLTVSLSADGNRLAVGAQYEDVNGYLSGQVRAFAWSGDDWTQLGNVLNGSAAGDNFGRAVSLSADGLRLAVGASQFQPDQTRTGQVRVFDWSGDDWTQLGAYLSGEAAGDNFGHAVSLSPDGSRLAVGAPYNDSKGQVRVFDWSGDDWTQLGADLNGEAAGDQFGWAVSLSADGGRLAVARGSVFEWSGDTWTQIGPPAVYLSREVSLSADGNRLAMNTFPFLFKWSGGDWERQSLALVHAGKSVSLSADGSQLAVGEPYFADSSGRVWTLKLSWLMEDVIFADSFEEY